MAASTFSCHHPNVSTPQSQEFSYGPHRSQRLDLYLATRASSAPAPIAVLIHGGGWVRGSRKDAAPLIPSLLAKSFVVANIGYRVASEALAPAAAEDVRNAISWIASHSKEWNADIQRMLLVGWSAGAHLAMLAAVAPSDSIGGPQCKARAMISFWGITDVADLLGGAHARDFAQQWLPDSPQRFALAKKLSPCSYDWNGGPALCAVHSVNDDVVPFEQSEKLVSKLKNANHPATLMQLAHSGHAAPEAQFPHLFQQALRSLEELGVSQ